MHEYLMEIQRFFLGSYRFMVLAHSKRNAMQRGEEYLKQKYLMIYDMIPGTLKVVCKLKPSFGESKKEI